MNGTVSRSIIAILQARVGDLEMDYILVRRFLGPVKGDVPVHHRQVDLNILNLHRADLQRIAVREDEVRQFADLKAANRSFSLSCSCSTLLTQLSVVEISYNFV